MARIVLTALAFVLAGCGYLPIEPTPSPTAAETETTHADPVPANPSGGWDAVLVIEPEEGLFGRPVPVAEAVTRDHGTQTAVLGVLFIDTAYLETWLCSELVEEETPQCGGAVLLVEGLGQDELSDWQLRSAGNVQWLRDARLFGRIERR